MHLQALYHEPFGRPVSFTWMTCVNPPDTSALGCLMKIAKDGSAMQSGVGLDQVDITVPTDALDGVPAAARGNAVVGIATVACPGTLSMRASVPTGEIPYRCVEDGTGVDLPFERFAVSVKRIFVRENRQNANPGIAEVSWDGAPWPEGERRQTRACKNNTNTIDDCDGGEKHRLGVTLAPGAESGTDELGHTFHEEVILQYYATEGTFEFEILTPDGPSNHWAARKAAAGTTQTLWFVARDDRGGVGWTSREVDVQ